MRFLIISTLVLAFPNFSNPLKKIVDSLNVISRIGNDLVSLNEACETKDEPRKINQLISNLILDFIKVSKLVLEFAVDDFVEGDKEKIQSILTISEKSCQDASKMIFAESMWDIEQYAQLFAKDVLNLVKEIVKVSVADGQKSNLVVEYLELIITSTDKVFKRHEALIKDFEIAHQDLESKPAHENKEITHQEIESKPAHEIKSQEKQTSDAKLFYTEFLFLILN